MSAVALRSTVNLLPWRESEARAARLRLARQLGVCLAVVLAAVLFGVWQLRSMAVAAEAEVSALRSQVAANSARAAAAQATVNEIARWKGFAPLESTARESHRRVLDFLRDVSAQTVTGMSLHSVEFTGEVIEVKGMAQSKSLAVDFVRAIKARGWPAAAPIIAASDGTFKEFQFLVKPKVKKKK